ncbi:MAG: acyl-CoA dehydrogenase [Flavobacteriales bacterium TMED288]|nr:acyl-CoA dehydrogenase [Flavobacteriales bacterium]RPG53457.1 MAG: acyl-CoA dehydrogenase [Flavobacteriales bacterium TMED288]|tara:strand:- start:1321 stop:3102 length:1782 start_codon:yes stop_codon:yes gene_type:complete
MEYIKGGEFIIKEIKSNEIFIREEFSEEQKMMLNSTKDFNEKEIRPKIMKFEEKEYSLVEETIKKAGSLGLLGINIPEKYGGLGMGFNTGMLICEEISSLTGSVATAFGAHTGIGTLPILLYGNEDQKKYYLPKIATGEWMACYNLTEPNAGSDANSGKTVAVITSDKKFYEITGQKIWISNAGFAHVFIVFARIENDKNLTAFLFEKNKVSGLTLNPEEKKLGLRSSSTRQVFYNKMKIPISSMLGKRGEGFKIAMNALNVGRIKLGVAVTGASKKAIEFAVKYANERKQFNQKISKFGAIQYKLAEMTTKTYVSDAANYRAGQDIENHISRLIKNGLNDQQAKLEGAEEYAIECAINKVFSSEVIAYVSDEALQIYGGMGYSAESEVEAFYRDARISRIYEGTNEINRLLIVKMLLKKSMNNELNLIGSVKSILSELMSVPKFNNEIDSILLNEKKILKNLKKLTLLIAGKSVERFGKKITEEQEIMINLANMIIQVYVLESVILKTEKLTNILGVDLCNENILMTVNFTQTSIDYIQSNAKECIYSISENDELKILMLGLKRFTKSNPVNIKENRRKIAKKIIQEESYCF